MTNLRMAALMAVGSATIVCPLKRTSPAAPNSGRTRRRCGPLFMWGVTGLPASEQISVSTMVAG